MSKISQYTAITSVKPDDLLVVVDVHDTTMAPSGTTKNMTLAQLAPAPVTAVASASGATTLDPLARVYDVTMTGNVTFTFTPSSTLAAATSYVFSVFLRQDSNGGHAATWPGSVSWLGGSTPVLPATASAVSLLIFETVNAGTTWYGSAVQEIPALPLDITEGGTGAASQQAAINALAGATTSGLFLRGNGSNVAMAAIQAGDLPYQAWQFNVQAAAYGAKGDGKVADDVTFTGSPDLHTLTTVGLSAPATPTLSNSGSGGSLTAGTYQVKVSYVNVNGESLASASAGSQAISGSQPLTITAPAGNRNATGYYAYVTQANGATFTRQQTAGHPTPLATNLVLTANPSSGGANPPGANTSQTTFTSGDVGKHIVVSQAGGSAHTPLVTTISGFTNSTTVTVTAAASGTVSGVGAIYGTDDTAAIQAAINAAVAYAQTTTSQYAEVVFPPAYYVIAGSPVLGGSTLGNSQITLPVIAPSSGPKVSLKLTGVSDVSAPPAHWLGTMLDPPGSVLVCANASGTYDGTYGPSAVIGGPVGGYGGPYNPPGQLGLYTNIFLTVDGLTCLLPWSTTIGGFNLYGVGAAHVKAFSVMPMAVAPTATNTAWPLLAGGPPDNQYPAGLIMPDNGNNDVNDIDYYTVYGQYFGLVGADHLTWHTLRTLFCAVGWLPVATNSGSSHSTAGMDWSSESCQSPIYTIQGSATWPGYKTTGPVSMNIGALSVEGFASGIITGDSNSLLAGIIYFENVYAGGHGAQGYHNSPLVDFNTVKLVSLESIPGPVASPAAAPATTVAWLNGYYRDAEITLSVSGGTLSALSIDSTAQTVPASTTFYRFTVPSGHFYTPTFTGSLTHTVTLL